MARSTPAPAPVSADAQPEPAAASAVQAEAVALTDMPVIVALLAYLSAISALAGFPSRPVPDALVQAIGRARQALIAALSEPLLSAPLAQVSGESGDAYDDAWIRESFTNLDEALKARFGALDEAFSVLGLKTIGPIHERLAALDSRLAALEAQEAATPPSDGEAQA